MAEACLDGGAALLQVRWKSGTSGALLRLVDRVVTQAAATGARVIVNDRPDVARLAGAPGVHVGQDDLTPADVRRVAPGVFVGLWTHTREQVDHALASACAYLAVGPVFGSATKDTGYTARGLELVRYAGGRGKPVVAIGGITLARAREVVEAGADAVAVISDLLTGSDVAARVRAFRDVLPPRPFNV